MARKGRWTTSFTGPPPPARRRAGQPRLGFGGPAQGVTAVGPRHPPQPHRGGPLPPPRRPPRPHQARLWLFARCAPRALRAARTGARSLLLTSFFQPPLPPSQAHPRASWSPVSDPARWQASKGPGASGSGVGSRSIFWPSTSRCGGGARRSGRAGEPLGRPEAGSRGGGDPHRSGGGSRRPGRGGWPRGGPRHRRPRVGMCMLVPMHGPLHLNIIVSLCGTLVCILSFLWLFPSY